MSCASSRIEPLAQDGMTQPTGGRMSQIRFINPQALGRPPGYTHVVEITAPGRIVYIAGQLGVDRNGKVGSDFRAQAAQTYENLKKCPCRGRRGLPSRREVQQLSRRSRALAGLSRGAR